MILGGRFKSFVVSTTGIPFPVLWKELLLSPCSLISLVLMEIRNLIQSNLNSNYRIAPFKVVTSAHNKLQISDNLTLKEIGVKLCTNRWVMWTLLHQNYSSRKNRVWNQNFGSVHSFDISVVKYYHNVLQAVFPSYLLNFCTGNHFSSNWKEYLEQDAFEGASLAMKSCMDVNLMHPLYTARSHHAP